MAGHALARAADHLARHVDAVGLEAHRQELRRHHRRTAAHLEQSALGLAEEIDDDRPLRDERHLPVALTQVFERERVEQRLDLRLGGKRCAARVIHTGGQARSGP